MKRSHCFVLLVIFTVILLGCISTARNATNNEQIHIVSYEFGGNAVYWSNGQEYILPNTEDSLHLAIAINP